MPRLSWFDVLVIHWFCSILFKQKSRAEQIPFVFRPCIFLSIYPFIPSPYSQNRGRHPHHRGKEEEKRIVAPVCLLDLQPFAKWNSVLGAHHNKGGLRALVSRQGLGSSPGKAPQALSFSPKTPIISSVHFDWFCHLTSTI